MTQYFTENSKTELYESWIGDGAFATMRRSAYLFVLLFLTIIAWAIYLGSPENAWETSTKLAVVFNLMIIAIHFCYRLSYIPRNWLAPDLIYLVSYSLFHIGYLVLWTIGTVPASDSIFTYPNLFPKTMLITNLGVLGFLAGYEFIGRPQNQYVQKPQRIPSMGWPMIGIILMLASLTIHLVYIFRVGVETFLLHGYQVSSFMWQYVENPLLWTLQPQLFALGFAIYIISVAITKRKLFSGKLGLILFGIQISLLILEGSRTPIVTIGMILVLIRHYVIKPFTFKSVAVMFISAVMLFGAIGLVRNVTSFDVAKMGSELKSATESGKAKWYDPVVEMGGSIRTVNLTSGLIPATQSHWHGRSYAQSLVHLVPFLQSYTLQNLGATPAGWLTLTLYGHDAAGTGFSIAGEGYLNFGVLGVFPHMFMIGLLLKWLYVRFAIQLSPSRTMVFVASLGIFLISVRGHTNLIFAPLAQIIVLAWLMKKLCGEHEVIIEEQPVDDIDLESSHENETNYVHR